MNVRCRIGQELKNQSFGQASVGGCSVWVERSGMSAERVVVRRARPEDAEARAQLLAEAFAACNKDAFLYFFFHEATLQAVVLCGAGLFILCGCGAWALAALPGAAGALLLAAVSAAHAHAAARQAARLRQERAGWVAECRGPPRPPSHAPRRIVIEVEEEAAPGRGVIVGTVSVSGCRDAAGGWLHGLAVRGGWRRRGLGRALEAGARAGAASLLRYRALHAVTSALQPAARALLHDAGWQCAGAYARPLLGAALTLPLARLECDLAPPA